MQKEENIDKWIKFLDPENLKENLLFSSLYIASFESFKDYIIQEVKSFFSSGFKNDELIVDPKYETHVTSRDRSSMKASLLWLKEMEAINDSDILVYEELRIYRNKLSHELMNLLFEGIANELPHNYTKLVDLSIKIEKWWILNIEIPTNPDFDSIEEIDEEKIITSSQMINILIMDMLSGDEKKASFYKNEFNKFFNK